MSTQVDDPKKKIFLIEDDKDIAFLYERELKKSDFDVFVVHAGSGALKKAKEYKPDLLLLDLLLPDVSGFNLLKQIKEDKDLKKVPVFVLTNMAEEITLDKALEMGADEYLGKSDRTPQDLVNHVKQHFREHNH